MPTLTQKPLSWFKTNPQVRKTCDQDELLRLGESLKAKQLQPVLCLADGTMIFGHRRLASAQIVGLETLDVIIADEGMSEQDIKRWQLVENMQRADLTGHEQFKGCHELKEMNSTWQLKDLAKALNIDPSTVCKIMSPSKCTEQWQDALRDGKVSISDCYVASKLPPEKQSGLLALKLSGVSRDELERAERDARNGSKDSVKISRVRCEISCGQTVTVSGPSMGLHELIEALNETIKEARKARESGLDVKTFQAVLRDKAKVG